MRTNLYDVLGVNKDASKDEIKKAYRNLSKKYHPDTKPDDPKAKEKFEEITVAYKILSDERKKARYDATGEIEEHTFNQKLQSYLGQTFMQFVETVRNPKIENVIEQFFDHTVKIQNNLEQGKKKVKSKIERTEEISKRITTTNEDDCIKSMLNEKINILKRDLVLIDEEVEFMEKVLEFLQMYDYEVDVDQNIKNFTDSNDNFITIRLG